MSSSVDARAARARATTPGAARGRWLEGLALLTVALVAAWFRLYRLSETPPGLHHDEAVNGLDILWTIPASHPIFFETNNGREPLFIYLQALAVQLLGPSALALRLTAAVVGIATVLATYWLARGWFGRRVAWLAALGLATSFWHVDLSRVGLRAIAAPLFLVLTLGLLWHGLRRRSLPVCMLGGLAAGLGLYTYISARLTPFLILAIVGWEAVRHRGLRGWWLGLLVFAAVATAAAAPLGLYFAGHPGSLLGRSGQVSIFNPSPTIEGEPTTFDVNLKRTLGMFFVRGDDNPRHNLPGRPVFDPAAAPWFVLGLLVASHRTAAALRPSGASAHAPAAGCQSGERSPSEPAPLAPEPAAWLLLWLGSTLALGAVTYESPNYLRLTALAPAVYVTLALGLDAAWRWLAARRSPIPTAWPAVTAALVVALLAGEAVRTYHDYFDDWAGRADVYQAFDAGLAEAARHVEGAPPPSAPTFLYVDRSPTVLFLSPQARAGRWVQEYSSVLLLPRSAEAGARYVFAGDGGSAAVPRTYLAALRPAAQGLSPDGRPTFTSYGLSAQEVETLARPAVPASLAYSDARTSAELLGYTLDSGVAEPGGRLGVTLVWRQTADAEVVYAPYLHVRDAAGHLWGQDDRLGFVVGGWRKGDVFLSRHEWAVPVDAPPLTYRFEVGLAVRSFGWPPGPPEALGPPSAIGSVRVDRSGPAPSGLPLPAVGHRLDAPLGAGLTLVGYDGSEGQRKPGSAVAVDLLWRADGAPGRDVLVRLSLVDDAGRAVATESARPAYGEYPTDRWPFGAYVRDPRSVTVPGSAASGKLGLVVETIDAASGEVLGRAALDEVEVVAPERVFTLPPMQRQVDASFGDEIALRGLDLEPETAQPGGVIRLTLYWQALRAPSKDYTVFTHLLDQESHVVAQQDNPPARGGSPTLGWAPGQVVRDDYELKLPAALPPGELVLEVGLYDARTGQRLRLAGAEDDRVIVGRVSVGGADRSAGEPGR